MVPSVVGFSQAVLKAEGFFGTLLSWFGFLTDCSIFLFWFIVLRKLGLGLWWKSVFGSFQVSSKMQFNVTMRCSTVPLRSTGQLLSRVFVVLLRKSIP